MALLNKTYPITAFFFGLPNYQGQRSQQILYNSKSEAIEPSFEWQLVGAKYCQESVSGVTCLLPTLCLTRELFCYIE